MSGVFEPVIRSYNAVKTKTSNQSYEDFKNISQLHSLDGLRCLSILMVIWHHAFGDSFPKHSILSQGNYGVTFFFIISGYLITRLLIKEKSKTHTINFMHFYIRRGLRIFPLYYAVLFLYVLLVYSIEKNSSAGQDFFANFIYFATYTSNYFVVLNADRVIFYFAWSLAAEEQFYLVWPQIEKYCNSASSSLIALGIIFMYHCIDSGQQLFSFNVHISFIIQHIAVPILYGVLLAHALNNRAMFKLLHGVLCSSYAVLMLAILTLYMLAFYTSHPVYLLLSMTLLIASAILSKPSFILNNRLSLMIGKYSYGMYLFHMLCINIVRKIDQTMHLPDFVELMLIIILTVVVAHISYHAFEKRFIQLKRFYQ